MTPDEFKRRAQELYDKNEGWAGEDGHMAMDSLMIECLMSNGYDEGCHILLNMDGVWYAEWRI